MDGEDYVKIEVEDPEAPEGCEDPESLEGNKIAKLRDELSACRKEKQEYMDGWQRAKADYVNLLKRIEGDTKASELRGKVKAVGTLLPAFDALERSKEHGEIPEGFTAIARQIESAFASLGLEEVGKVGEQFDPAMHEAFGQDATQDSENDNKIIAVLEKGWCITGSVIRPAKVRVAHFGG